VKLGRLSDIAKAIKLGGSAINKNIGNKPSDTSKAIKHGGQAINFKSFGSKPLAFVLLAFVIGATVSQGSFAFADDSATNPFRAIWDAIGELQVKTESLQAQIDDLKSQQGTVVSAQTITKSSEVSLDIDISGGDGGQTLITLVAANAGPDSAVGVKLTTFYETPLLRVNFIDGAECSDGSRGIIECYLGTITEDSEARVVIDADPILLEQRAIVTADISSITDDSDLGNNHAESVFVTSFNPVVQPSQEEEQEEQPSQEPEETGQGEGTSEEQTGGEESEQAPEEQTETGEEQPAEEPQEGEQTSEEGAGESTEQGGEEGSSEQSEGTESSGEQSGDAGESGAEEGSSSEESSGDGDGESSGDGEASSGDSGSGDGSESSSDSGDSGSSDSGSDAGSGDSGGDSGDSGSSGDGGSSGDSGGDGGSDGGSGDGGSDGGSSGGDSGSTG